MIVLAFAGRRFCDRCGPSAYVASTPAEARKHRCSDCGAVPPVGMPR